jgi:hypothetical protein
LTLSEDADPVTGMLILAPTGVYTGRVKQGIDLVIGRYAQKSRTNIKVELVPTENWVGDLEYKARFVESIRDYVMTTWKEAAGYNITCEAIPLQMDEEEILGGWLLKHVCDFFKASVGRSVHIDLTAGPREWMLAAMNVASFFEKVELYYIKPKSQKYPKDYSEAQASDPGIPKLDILATSSTLSKWVTPKDEEGEANAPYILFNTIFEMAKHASHGSSANELAKVWVPIEEDNEIIEYKEHLPESLRVAASDRVKEYSTYRKSISKYLNAIQSFRLFEGKGKSVRMTYRGAMLGISLFSSNQQGTSGTA